MPPRSRILFALAAGFCISASLFCVLFVTDHDYRNLLWTLQFPGFLIVWLQPGSFESATTTQYCLIGIPVNAAFYAAIIYILLRIFRRAPSVTGAQKNAR